MLNGLGRGKSIASNLGLFSFRNTPEFSYSKSAGRAGQELWCWEMKFSGDSRLPSGLSEVLLSISYLLFFFFFVIMWSIYICYRKVSKYRQTKEKITKRKITPKKTFISHLELISFKQNTIYSFIAVVDVSCNTDQLTYCVMVSVTTL